MKNAILLELASELNKRWSNQLEGSRTSFIATPLEVATAIERLANAFPNLRTVLDATSEVTDAVLHTVEEEVKGFQYQVGALKVDGILGKRSLRKLGSMLGCRPLIKERTGLPEIGRDQRQDEIQFLYFIERLPVISGTDVPMLVERAWSSWNRFACVRNQQVTKADRANVIIRTGTIDGPSGMGALATVGPPDGLVLDITIDSAEDWTPRLFEGAICHEIGHILGLHHDPEPGRLMNAFLPDLIEPTQGDGDHARALPHLGPPCGT